MGELKKWREQKWVRIGTDGSGATASDVKSSELLLPASVESGSLA